MHASLSEWLERLPLPATGTWPHGVWDIEAMARGTMSLVLFAPRGKDYQTTHDRDELYVIVKGSGTLVVDDEPTAFATGDALFVAAGSRHHFEQFTDDLETWAIFWGPKGGEAV